MVPWVADMDTNIMHQGGIFQPFTFAVRQAMDSAGLIEQRRRQPSHLLRVLRPVAAALAQLDDASPADIGIPIDLRNVLAITGNVIKNEPFAKRVVTERELFSAKLAQDRIEQHRPRDE